MALVCSTGYLDVSLLYHLCPGIMEKGEKELELKAGSE